jgi:hypothetical protein
MKSRSQNGKQKPGARSQEPVEKKNYSCFQMSATLSPAFNLSPFGAEEKRNNEGALI